MLQRVTQYRQHWSKLAITLAFLVNFLVAATFDERFDRPFSGESFALSLEMLSRLAPNPGYCRVPRRRLFRVHVDESQSLGVAG